MMKLITLFIFLGSLHINAQHRSKYGVELINDVSTYKAQLKDNPKMKLVNLREYEGLYFEIRYATRNNFLNKVVYPTAGAYARIEVAEALQRANKVFEEKGLAIKVFDAYRPYDATVQFYELVKDTTYVASPYNGSRHNRACAVDITLVNKNTAVELNMPTAFDDFTKKAHVNYTKLSEEQLNNRQLLIQVMKEAGFEVYPFEWWHFDYKGWQDYPLMNLSFEDLKEEE